MRFNKKASLEISIQAIVIVVLAMTLLGLGLGFIRKQFASITGIQEDVTEQVRQKILDDLITTDKKISFPKSEITIDKGGSTLLTVGVRNKKDTPLNYKMRFQLISGPPGTSNTIIDSPKPWFQLAPFASQNYVLGAAESTIRNIRLSIPTEVLSGSYYLIFEVLEGNTVYEQKDFFVVVRG